MRTSVLIRRLLVPVGVAAATSCLLATPALAAPLSDGCPAGYDLLSVAVLAPQGYRVPGQVDDPNSGVRSFGSLGNGDGWVCAVALGSRTTPWGGQIYNFWDNTLQAG
jgi:hypothetical protein